MPRTRVPLALLCSALVGSGCGSGQKGAGGAPSASDDQGLVRATLTRFADATGRHDYPELCRSVFAPTLLQKLAPVNVPCEQALERLLSSAREPKLAVDRVQVERDGKSALAFVHTSAQGQPREANVVRLVKTPGGWRISNLGSGPSPTSPPPGSGPAPKPPPPGTPND